MNKNDIILVDDVIGHVYNLQCEQTKWRYKTNLRKLPNYSPTPFDLEAIRKTQLKRQRKQQTKTKLK